MNTKKPKITVSNIINSIDGNDDVAEINGEKIVKTKLVNELPVMFIHSWFNPINIKYL